MRARAPAEEGGEPLACRADPLLQHDRAGGVLDADLGFLLVHVHANMVHGWPPLRCGIDRVNDCGAQATTCEWRPAASPHLSEDPHTGAR